MTWEFKVGQKVVCVDDAPLLFRQDMPLKKNSIYEIEGMRGGYLLLVGVADDEKPASGGFRTSRFRPLVTETQSWLKEILESPPPAPVKIPIMHPDFTTEYVEIGDGWGMR